MFLELTPEFVIASLYVKLMVQIYTAGHQFFHRVISIQARESRIGREVLSVRFHLKNTIKRALEDIFISFLSNTSLTAGCSSNNAADDQTYHDHEIENNSERFCVYSLSTGARQKQAPCTYRAAKHPNGIGQYTGKNDRYQDSQRRIFSNERLRHGAAYKQHNQNDRGVTRVFPAKPECEEQASIN